MAYDLREIHQASWSEAVFTDGDANKRILDALLGAKEGGENILISVYTDTKRRARRQLWGGYGRWRPGLSPSLLRK